MLKASKETLQSFVESEGEDANTFLWTLPRLFILLLNYCVSVILQFSIPGQ